jgi:hypothetical protein
MPIRPPALDDRCYDDLVKELIARIPAHTPEWTNPRTGDPGRTMIDLFAWLGDALLYRVNLIPERQRLVFLRLLGQPLRPASPSRSLVTVSLKPEEKSVAYRIKAGANFTGAATFECSDEFTVLPVNTAMFYKRNPLPGEVDQSVQQALSTVQNNGAPVQPYITTQLFQKAQQTTAFDVFGGSKDKSLWFALLAPKANPAEEQKTSNESVLKILSGDDQGQRMLLNIGFVPGLPTLPDDDQNSGANADSTVSNFNIVPSVPAGDLPGTGSIRARVPHIWEAAIKTEKETIDAGNPWKPRYIVLDEVSDSTQGLTRSGIIRLALPRGQVLFAPSNDLREDINAGVGDRPPRIDDKTIVSQLVGWIRLRPRPPQKSVPPEQQFTPGSGTRFDIPQISSGADTNEVEHLWATWLGVNAVAVDQLVTRKNIIIGESNGTADQQFSLPATSVESETLQIFVEEDSGWVQWNRVDDLYTLDRDPTVARDARVFQLDPEAGTIRFGDGVRGRIPGTGRRVLVGQMRSSSGAAGNLPAGYIKTVIAETLKNENVGSSLVVDQPMPFIGGTDAETLAEAEKRIPALFRHRDRAVTLEDYRTIALETPGAAVARVEILPRFKPQQRFFNVPGIVSVMVLPQAQLGPAPNPRADRPFLEKVHAWLDARRPVGTELYVIGCEYVPVAISVAVSVADGAATDTTLQAVKDALIKVLWPLQGGGFDGNGWRVKKAISNRELAAEVARVPGVSEVNELNLFKRIQIDNKRSWKAIDDASNGNEQNIGLNDWQFPELLGVVAVSGNDAPLDIDSYLGLGDYSGNETDLLLGNGVAVPVASSLYCTCGRQL